MLFTYYNLLLLTSLTFFLQLFTTRKITYFTFKQLTYWQLNPQSKWSKQNSENVPNIQKNFISLPNECKGHKQAIL